MSSIKIILLFYLGLVLSSCKNTPTIPQPTKEKRTIDLEQSEEEQIPSEAALQVINDLDVGIAQAKIKDKPILLIFTGFGVVDGRRLESEVLFRNEKIYTLMRDHFINVWLYVDEKNEKGKKWRNVQTSKFKGNTQPQLFILDANGKTLEGGLGYKETYDELLPLLQKYTK